MKDLVFIAYAGMIRGAVAFGLVLRIEPEVEHRSVIVTTSLALVCFTTIVLGSTVATMQRCLFGKIEHGTKVNEEIDGHDANTSHHDEVLHPNIEDEKKEAEGALTPIHTETNSKKNSCIKYLKRMDVAIIKPLLIYKYEQKAHKKQKEYFEILMKEGKNLEELYTVNANGENDVRKSNILNIVVNQKLNSS